jgi:hypothetical protein
MSLGLQSASPAAAMADLVSQSSQCRLEDHNLANCRKDAKALRTSFLDNQIATAAITEDKRNSVIEKHNQHVSEN